MFVSQTSQVLALLGVFLDVGMRGGVPAPLMAFGLLFASSYFSVITPQGGSQNIIFVGERLPHAARALQAGAPHHAGLPGGVPADRDAVDHAGDLKIRQCLLPPDAAARDTGLAVRGSTPT